jgi:hypothetical protein
MAGHKTESIYRRYAIVDEGMLKEAAAKLQTFHEAQVLASPAEQGDQHEACRSEYRRVSRAQRARWGRAARAKSLPAGEKKV